MAELLVRRDGPVGRVIFSNPEKFNAMTQDMWAALPAALQELDADPVIRVIVLQGEGSRAFVSGADISQFKEQRTDPVAQKRYNGIVEAAYLAPTQCSKPVIASIRGICMGGGLGLAAACDLRIAAQGARFRMPAARLGLGYNVGGIKRFMAVIGAQNTLDIFFSARIFGASEAREMGFLNRVVEPGELDKTVNDYCALLADNAPLTMAAAKKTVVELIKDPADRDEEAMAAAIAACNTSDDYREGAQAFMEKRLPQFSGK